MRSEGQTCREIEIDLRRTSKTRGTPVIRVVALRRRADGVGVTDLTSSWHGVGKVKVNESTPGLAVGGVEDDDGVVVDVAVQDASKLVQALVGCARSEADRRETERRAYL